MVGLSIVVTTFWLVTFNFACNVKSYNYYWKDFKFCFHDKKGSGTLSVEMILKLFEKSSFVSFVSQQCYWSLGGGVFFG